MALFLCGDTPPPSCGLVDLEMCRRGAIFPAAQSFYDRRATQGTRPLAVEPQTQALLTEDVLTHQSHRLSELGLANGAHVPGLGALLVAGPHAVTLGAAEDPHGLPDGSDSPTDVEGLAQTVDYDQHGPQEVATGRVLPNDVPVPQLDGNQRSEQLTQLLDQQVELPPGFEGEEDLRQEKDEALEGDSEVLEDEVSDPHGPDQVEEVKGVDVGLRKDEEDKETE